MAEHTLQITDQTFQELVAHERPTLVDFWADWCGPCHKIAPILDELAAEHADKLTVAKLNVDENPHTAMEFNVMSIPTLILFTDGVEKKRLAGAVPSTPLRQNWPSTSLERSQPPAGCLVERPGDPQAPTRSAGHRHHGPRGVSADARCPGRDLSSHFGAFGNAPQGR